MTKDANSPDCFTAEHGVPAGRPGIVGAVRGARYFKPAGLLIALAVLAFATVAPLRAQTLTDQELVRLWEQEMQTPGRNSTASRAGYISGTAQREPTAGEAAIIVAMFAVLIAGGTAIVIGIDWTGKEIDSFLVRIGPKPIGARGLLNPMPAAGEEFVRFRLENLPTKRDAPALESVSPPIVREPEKVSAQWTPEKTPVAAPPRVVIEMVADPKFKANLGSVSEAFREVVSDHREFVQKLVRAGDFHKVIEHFRREEQRTHNSLRCASFVMSAFFDSLKEVQVIGQLVGRITPESDQPNLLSTDQLWITPRRQYNAVYRNTFFMQLPSGRRSLQASDLSMPGLTPKLPELEPEPEILWENGKDIIRPHTHLMVPINTIRLTFSDGEEVDISSDVSFAGLSEEDFKVAYAAFEETRARLYQLNQAPSLNSKFQKDIDRENRERGTQDS